MATFYAHWKEYIAGRAKARQAEIDAIRAAGDRDVDEILKKKLVIWQLTRSRTK
jgi:hypothetical protein